jgi:hypothetical protein
LDGFGTPVPAAGVRVVSTSSWQRTQSDSFGGYQLWVPTNAGPVYIGSWKSGYAQPCAVEVPRNDTRVNVTLVAQDDLLLIGNLPAEPDRRRVEGTVYELDDVGRRPVGGAWVGWEPLTDNPAADTYADGDGRYALCGLPTTRIFGLFASSTDGRRVAYASVAPGGDTVVDIHIGPR